MNIKAYNYLRNCKRILDVGCGHGKFIELNPSQIEGVDINQESVDVCFKKGLRATQGNALELPFKYNKFDGVHCSHLIEHLLPDQAFKLLTEIDRVLKIDGFLVIQTPLMSPDFYSEFDHIKPYEPQTLINQLCTKEQKQKTYNQLNHYKLIKIHYRWRRCSMKFWNWINIQMPLFKNGYMIVLKKVSE